MSYKFTIAEKKHLIKKIEIFMRDINSVLKIIEDIETWEEEEHPEVPTNRNMTSIILKIKTTKPILNEVKEWLKLYKRTNNEIEVK